ncbi:MAG: RNA polymerase sigma factor FliA [Campylobacterales bacterium]|nr:RNA polymerase sigma factor FliA [Campylobacterales bacterium]
MANAAAKAAYEQNSLDSQNDLAVKYLPAVKAMSYRLKERLPSSIDATDLISIGAEELIKLARRYDASLNDSFWGYAKKRVYGSMLDFLRSLDTVSRTDRKLIKDVEKAVMIYMSDHSEEPTDEWLAKELDEDVAKIQKARGAADTYGLMSIDDQMQFFGDDDTESSIEQEELVDIIRDILDKMPEREQMIIQLYFFEELNLKEISQVLNITESRISQIIKSITRKIREQVVR